MPGAPRVDGRFRSLRVPNFRLFFVGQIVSQTGNWLTLVALTLLVFRETNSGIALGLLAAAQFGPVLLLGPYGGLVADRSDKRRLLLAVQVAALALSGALATLAFTGHASLVAAYAIAALRGVTMAFGNPTRKAIVVDMVPAVDVSNAVSLTNAAMISTRVVGPALAGVAITTFGFGWTFAADALSFLAIIGALAALRTAELHPVVKPPRGPRQIRAGFWYVRRTPVLWIPLVMLAVTGTLAYNYDVVFPLFATRDLDGADTTYTILFSALSVGSLVGALVVARRETIEVRTIAGFAIRFGAALAVMAISPTLAVAALVGLGMGFASITFLTACTAIVELRADPEMRGRVLALQSVVVLGSAPVGGPIVGWICEQFGARFGLGIGAVAAVGAGAWGLVADRRTRERPLPTP